MLYFVTGALSKARKRKRDSYRGAAGLKLLARDAVVEVLYVAPETVSLLAAERDDIGELAEVGCVQRRFALQVAALPERKREGASVFLKGVPYTAGKEVSFFKSSDEKKVWGLKKIRG
jgi:hypothetical protein